MKWKKKGLICSRETLDLAWYRRNTMVPVPVLKDDNTIRIFLTFCDNDNIGRIGYVDVDAKNPLRILDHSRQPSLDIGSAGSFDDSGVLSSAVFTLNNKLYMIYSAYQRQVKIPYTIYTGLAVSNDLGRSFNRSSNVPLLDACENELFVRSAAFIHQTNDRCMMWYSSGSEWFNNGRKSVPRYDIRYLESRDILSWTQQSERAISLQDDEYGLTTPNVFIKNNRSCMIFSVRSISKGYRLGYAESKDGRLWKRMDDRIGIDVSDNGWDSEMVCFGNILKTETRVWLFYCGNHYGMGGVGAAELIEW